MEQYKPEILLLLKQAHPNLITNLDYIDSLLSTTRNIEYHDFFEPLTVLIEQKGQPVRVELDADLLLAWIMHMSHSCRRRMELFEDQIFESLLKRRLLVAGTLVRAHIEAASWAAYCLEELTKATDKSDWSKLREPLIIS